MDEAPKTLHSAEDDPFAQPYRERAFGAVAYHLAMELARAVVAQPFGGCYLGRMYGGVEAFALCA